MTTRTKFTAVYERDSESDAWLVHVDGIDGCQTHGRTLRQAEERIREALGAWFDTDPDQFVLTNQLPEDLVATVRRVESSRAVAERAGSKAKRETIDAVVHLTEMGLSRRDAADLLGISHQRVQQLLLS